MLSKSTIILILTTLTLGYAVFQRTFYRLVPRNAPALVCPTCPKCKDFSSTLKDIETLTKQLGQGPQPKMDEMGALSALVGQYEKVAEVEADKVALQKYIKDCAKIPSAWFCFDTLADRVEVKKGTYSYFLVVNRLTSPELFALCNFMWSNTTMDRWARHYNRACREFDKHYTEP